jgi:hypothetical protein
MRTAEALRPIDQRYVPPVAGIDLEQALNYIDMDMVGEEFIYRHYTSRRLFYVPGSRPALEQAAAAATERASTDLQRITNLAKWVAENVRWAGYYQKGKGHRLATDRSPTEEQLLLGGYGWCNEQARLFCLLSQIAGIPSRLVFASKKTTQYGHCISEALVDDQWLAVDQSLGFCFVIDNAPIRASQIVHDEDCRAHFTPIYTDLCRRTLKELGPGIEKDFAMAAADNPLEGFTNLGYLNYFAH